MPSCVATAVEQGTNFVIIVEDIDVTRCVSVVVEGMPGTVMWVVLGGTSCVGPGGTLLLPVPEAPVVE